MNEKKILMKAITSCILNEQIWPNSNYVHYKFDLIKFGLLSITNRDYCCHMKVFLSIFFLFIIGFSNGQDLTEFGSLFNDLKVLSSDGMEGRKTGTAGNKKARQYIQNRFDEIGLNLYEENSLHEFETPGETFKVGYNIIGFLPGRSKDVIVISAHYDHLGIKDGQIFNGSDDNASGVSVLLYLAEKARKSDLHHTLIFVTFDAEEEGLLGAHAFVANPPVPIEKIIFNVNFDMVSRNGSKEIFASGTYHNPRFRDMIRDWRGDYPIKIRLGHDNPGDKKNDWTNSSDHAAFHKMGIPYLYFGVEDHEDYHKSTDTYDKTDFEFFGQVAKVLSDLVLRLDKLDIENDQ